MIRESARNDVSRIIKQKEVSRLPGRRLVVKVKKENRHLAK